MHLASKIVDFFFPRHCINCSTPWAYLCKPCKKELHPHPEICPYCHRASKDYLTCIECRTNKDNALEGIIIPFAYNTPRPGQSSGVLKTLIIKLKYFHKKDISNFLIERLAIALQVNQIIQKQFNFPPLLRGGVRRTEGFVNSPVLISFIPSHRYRHYFTKGYNQSELLADKLSKYIQIPMITIANKYKHTKTQASLDRNGRLHNLKNAFSLAKNLTLTGNETLLIIDDITTTWSTINELAKLVKHHYPNIKVWWVVLGRHM
ncbi:MAG: phosphoribosyltransferase [uncultured bacterium (gcode 4)]|uniref:Phosphoribosyltransferase n=1 Tax=uncultured bacterium (gcode 4) TaxID=1234023 RepID=K1XJD8_9BACT|nr:MAG: phosphoribosyltransferase [uncultured bacterium (gcode 4)]